MSKEFRFCVGRPGEMGSTCWKLWIQGDEVYLRQRYPENNKFSFHSSGICRWALNAGIEPRGGGDRAMRKWRREPVPEAGSGRASVLMRLAFPTDHLATKDVPNDARIQWVDPAPEGKALGVTIILTKESPEYATSVLQKSGHHVLFASQTRSRDSVVAMSTVFDCGDIEFSIPGEPRVPGQVFDDLVFPASDVGGKGRKVRLTLITQKEVPPTVWELGGHRATD